MITTRKVARETARVAATVGVYGMRFIGVLSIAVACSVIPLALLVDYIDPTAFEEPVPCFRLAVETVVVFITGCVLVAIARLLSSNDQEEL